MKIYFHLKHIQNTHKLAFWIASIDSKITKIFILPAQSQSKQFSFAYPKVHNVQFLYSCVAFYSAVCRRHVEFAILLDGCSAQSAVTFIVLTVIVVPALADTTVHVHDKALAQL